MFEERCNKYTDCASCGQFRKGIFKFRSFPRGIFLPKERCSQNIMYFILKGEVWVNSNEHPDTILREGQFILQPVGSSVEFRIHTPVESVLYLFDRLQNVCDSRFQAGLSFVEGVTPASSVMKTCAFLRHYLEGMKLLLNDDLLCAGLIQAKQTELFYLLNSYYTIKDLSAFYSPIYSHGRSFHYFVMNNYQQAKDVEAFAQLGGYTVPTFRRLFKETFDEPVYQWMLKQKKLDIFNDITTTDMSITDISTKHGFESLANFSHFCRSNFGKSPRALRADNVTTF
ncbi:AraC-like DNA-binding protein [Parabacteroides sp. PF5-5]|uniref:helix-turn-helix domain-containing protein n=1 Tax=unclassified Parabacteroides TaxID=2649774 RepID=UPI00247544A8|nr:MULTISPECIES: AraC family transcriptional regulator [unclassified Parabacteroides]MDH6303496.1 AraC-like DNA-binding protein [Parabacteroides sp. PH5-39]MDH6314818.1 AraC-like DNA-binding protein [Parabacteroides sp. PF5-13]MDH6318155.1 AraC-like DNA-binding protein [Parabacteroides sp. PH5-13]MDH6321913.1 AraC-like DNA-binding protein [Parabacteroides sp. PH5-8]MDH6326037.1 AraC-like DNA-binding protein [Parabacteroides sp. PH5-41]